MPPGKSPPLLSRCILTLLSSALSLLAVWLQLALLDALSYDKDAKSGGANGSIANFPEELKALGLEGSLKTAVDQIRKAKEHAEKASAFPLELSMADAIVFAAYYKVSLLLLAVVLASDLALLLAGSIQLHRSDCGQGQGPDERQHHPPGLRERLPAAPAGQVSLLLLAVVLASDLALLLAGWMQRRLTPRHRP